MIGIETAYLFHDKKDESDYLKQLLNAFAQYMNDNNLNKNDTYCFFMCNPSLETKANTIEDLYTNFRIFVEGFYSVYGEKENKII